MLRRAVSAMSAAHAARAAHASHASHASHAAYAADAAQAPHGRHAFHAQRTRFARRPPDALRAIVASIVLCALAAAFVAGGSLLLPNAAAAAAPAGPRVALVIGNAGYRSTPLANPLNDARAMADALRRMGFDVISLENASLAQMNEGVRRFGDALQRGVGLFYYAGHGVQVKGRNFLLPVDADIEREDEVPYKAFDVGQVLAKMEAAHNPLNIVILDACRNNPFVRASRSGGSGGLAQMDAPTGSIVAFATAPGAEAADGAAGNGLYTSQLLRFMTTPGLKVEDVFKRTRVAVKQASAGRQIPWESTSLEGDFYFQPGSAGAAPTAGADLDDELWNMVAGTAQPSAYRAYLERFPEGKHAPQARSLAARSDGDASRAAGLARQGAPAAGGFSFSAEEARMDEASPQGRERSAAQQLAALACPPARRGARLRLQLDEPPGGAFAGALTKALQQAGMQVQGTGDYVVRGTLSVQARPHALLRVNEVSVSSAATIDSAAGRRLASSVLRDDSYAGSDVEAIAASLVRAQASQAAAQLLTQFCRP
ncbi:MAG: hypothetical protein AMXMBFR66_15550 [Pseudomonadota bacterium]|nr:caspase family protein [Rubrivivax sp.]